MGHFPQNGSSGTPSLEVCFFAHAKNFLLQVHHLYMLVLIVYSFVSNYMDSLCFASFHCLCIQLYQDLCLFLIEGLVSKYEWMQGTRVPFGFHVDVTVDYLSILSPCTMHLFSLPMIAPCLVVIFQLYVQTVVGYRPFCFAVARSIYHISYIYSLPWISVSPHDSKPCFRLVMQPCTYTPVLPVYLN